MPFIGNQPSAVPLTSADITDGIITSAKIADGTIVNADINASAAIASTKLSGSFGITEADQWRLTTNSTGALNPIASNFERNDSTAFAYIGSGMTQSSGIFTFPSTGIYLVRFIGLVAGPETSRYNVGAIEVTTNNSSYTEVARFSAFLYNVGTTSNSGVCESYVDVTSTSNVKVRFKFDPADVTDWLEGSTTSNMTHFTFIRLGDT